VSRSNGREEKSFFFLSPPGREEASFLIYFKKANRAECLTLRIANGQSSQHPTFQCLSRFFAFSSESLIFHYSGNITSFFFDCIHRGERRFIRAYAQIEVFQAGFLSLQFDGGQIMDPLLWGILVGYLLA